jgi:predicted XRE-type DNA-binding protein
MIAILLAIRDELTRRRMFQTTLARELDVSQKHISGVLSGNANCSLEFLLTMLDHLDLQITITRKARP